MMTQNNGKRKKLMIMKTWNYIKCLIVVVLCLILTNCSNESDIIETKVSTKDLKFVVNVSGINNIQPCKSLE